MRRSFGFAVASLVPLAAPPAQHVVPNAFALREGGREGLPPKQAKAIELGLQWLERHQCRTVRGDGTDGSWDTDDFAAQCPEDDACRGPGNPVQDVGITALALMAFLADEGGRRGREYEHVVERAASWLCRQQNKGSGLVGSNASHDYIYSHAIATIALCEAYGILGGSSLESSVKRAIGYLEHHRNPYMVWRYQPRDNDNDTSVTTWCVHALVLARDCGLTVDANALAMAALWYDQVTDPNTGHAGYSQRGEPSSRHPGDHQGRFPPDKGEALTASALYARYLLDQPVHRMPLARKAVAVLESKPPVWDPESGAVDYYYWYYARYALQAAGMGERWIDHLDDILISHQCEEGHAEGSWDPVGVWCEDGGRVYSTALALLMLEAPYRYATRDPLAGVPDTPKLSALRRHWEQGRFDRVATALDRLAPDDLSAEERAGILILDRALERETAFAMERVKMLSKGPDYAESQDALEEIEHDYDGLAPGTEASEVLAKWRKSPKIKAEIAASKAYAKLQKRYGSSRSGSQKTLRKHLDAFLQKYQGTYAARLARQWRDSLE